MSDPEPPEMRPGALLGVPAVAAEYMRSVRRARRLTSEGVAEQVGVHKSTVRRWERRERLPAPQHLARLSEVLAVDRDELVMFFDAARPGPAEPGPIRGSGLRSLRHAAGISARHLAAQLQINPARIYGWELGEFGIPRRHLPKIAAELGLPVGELERLLRVAPSSVHRKRGHEAALRKLRAPAMTLARAAAGAGVHPHTLRRWEQGVATPPSWALRRLAAIYDVPTSQVARAAGVKPSPLLDRRNWEASDFSDVIRVLREWHRLSQAQLAAAADRHVSAVERWEAGTALPGPEMMFRLELVLDLPFGALGGVNWVRRPSSAV